MAAARDSRLRRFFRLGEPRGRDIALWIILALGPVFRLSNGGDQVTGRRLTLNLVLLAVSLGFLALASFRLWRHHDTPSPDECSACGHEWFQHAIGYDVNGVCGGCALEIEHGMKPRVSDGCRLCPPLGRAKELRAG